MSSSLANRIALITGGGRGLGRHVALGLAQRGASVAVVARSGDEVQEAVEFIAQSGGKAWGMPLDVSEPEAVDQFRNRLLAELGPPTILVNAAGTFGPIKLIRDSDPQRWIDTLRTNAIGPYLVCRAFIDGMIAAGWGRIINFSSAASLHQPGPLTSAYATSKVALNHFTRHLAAELDGTGVTANVIHPGEVKTGMWAEIRDSAAVIPGAEPLRQWAAEVGEQGGDDPQLALDLVNGIIDGQHAAATGQFLWIAGGRQTPTRSWD